MRRLALGGFIVAASAVGFLGCGPSANAGCCSRLVSVPAGLTYRAQLGNPDGGPSTDATLTRLENGNARITFRQEGRVVEVEAQLAP